jgi:hypothetical protein
MVTTPFITIILDLEEFPKAAILAYPQQMVVKQHRIFPTDGNAFVWEIVDS